jgi:hypothetical protein
MRRFNKVGMAAMLGTLLTVTGLSAGTINQRRENQQDRIAQGIRSGRLTAGQTSRLEGKEARLNHEVRRDREDHDGRLTRGERAQINRQQNHLSRDIYRDKHD